MFKGFRQIVSLTVISRILGMIRDMALAFFFGAGTFMDGWVIAFMIPNLSRRLFGEGAASSSLIPIYSHELHNNPKNANRLASTVASVIFVLLTSIVLIGEAVIWIWAKFFTEIESTELILSLSGVMLPYMIAICMVAILGGILNSHHHFAAPAFAPIILNVFIISSLFFSGWVINITGKGQLYFVACVVLAAGAVQLILQIVPLNKLGVKLRPTWAIEDEAFKKILLLMGPMILGLTATQLNTLADIVIARIFSGSLDKGSEFIFFGKEIMYPMWDGAVSKLYYAQRLYQFPLGVFGISLATAIFPVMSTDVARGDFSALSKTVSRGIKGAIFVAAPAMIGLILVRNDLVSLVFERGEFFATDTAATSRLLIFYSIGLSGFFMQQILARAFYSLKDSKAPTRSAIIAVIVNVILNLILIWPLSTSGLALSTAICSYLQVAILLFILHKRLGTAMFDTFGTQFTKTITATILMFFIGSWTNDFLSGQSAILRLAAVVIVCGGFYTIAAKLMKNEMLSLIFQKKKIGTDF